MRPWYRYSAKTDDYQQATIITPFSRLWGYGATACLILIIINVGIWLIMVITNLFKWLPLEAWWYQYFALTPVLVLKDHWYWQILTSVFLHDGKDFLHLAVNMYLLWVFGPRVERIFGSRNFLFFYLATGIAGSLLSLMMRSIMGYSDVPSLGASSAVFGMLTAYGFLFANDILLLFFVIPMRAWVTVVLFIVLESLFVLTGIMQNVDHWAHLGGAAAAAIWMVVLVKSKGPGRIHDLEHYPMFGIRRRRGVHARQLGPPFGGFQIWSGDNLSETHPEGTDDEPPPKWFKA
jgi:membrane associated rhomboid family serine protease